MPSGAKWTRHEENVDVDLGVDVDMDECRSLGAMPNRGRSVAEVVNPGTVAT